MWALISEVIIFGILLALIVGYFNGFGLGINKDIKFDAQVNVITHKIDNKIRLAKKQKKESMMNNNQNNSNQNNNTGVDYSNITYQLTRLTYFDKLQAYKEYKFTFKTLSGDKLTYKQLEQIAKDIIVPQKKETSTGDNTTIEDINQKKITTCYTGTDYLPYLQPNSNWEFDKYKDVSGNGGVGTIAHYHNIGRWQGKDVDLLVQVVKLTNLTGMRLQDSTPKGFKLSELTDSEGKKAPNVGFFLRNRIEDPKGTYYAATLKFTFVDSKTQKPIKLNTEIQVYDLDNFARRTEKVTTSLDQFYKFQLSPTTHLTYDVIGNNISVYNNHNEDLRYFSPDTSVKFIIKDQSNITLTFDYIKNKDTGEDGGRAGFNVVVNPVNIGLPVCYIKDPNAISKDKLDDSDNSVNNNLNYVKVDNPNIILSSKVTSKRDNGYCYVVDIKNNSSEPLYNWKVKLDIDKKSSITDSWNWTGECINGVCNMIPDSWANPLAPSGTIELGFCAEGSNTTPSNINLLHLYVAPKDEVLQTPPSSCKNILSFNGSNQFAEIRLDNKIAGLDLWNLKSADGYANFCYDTSNNTLYYNQDLYNIKRKSNSFVIGYPELYVGSKPWNDYKTIGNGVLPIKLSEVDSLINELSYTIKSPSNLSMNIATEGWFTPKKYDNVTNSNPRDWIEFMIMWYWNLHNIDGDYKGNINIPVIIDNQPQFLTFKIYVSEGEWKFIKLIPVYNIEKFKSVNLKFDIKQIVQAVNDKISNDLINDYYLASWHFGTEWGDPYTTSAYLSRKVNKFTIKTNENTSNNNVSGILFYYGYPSLINGSKTLSDAENVFRKYKAVVLGWGLQNYTHSDFKNTYQIINDLKNVDFYGYVPLFDNGNMTITKLIQNILKWKSLGVKGIFLDEAGYDYFKNNMDYNTYKEYIKVADAYIKKLGLKLMINGYTLDYLDIIPFTKNDIVTIEDCYYYNGEYKKEYEDHTKDFISKINSLSIKPLVLCLATGKSNDANSVNNIFNNLLQKNLKVDYISVQDDYGSDSIVYWRGK